MSPAAARHFPDKETKYRVQKMGSSGLKRPGMKGREESQQAGRGDTGWAQASQGSRATVTMTTRPEVSESGRTLSQWVEDNLQVDKVRTHHQNYMRMHRRLHLPQKMMPRTPLVLSGCESARLPVQGTPLRSLVWEDPTCSRATKPLWNNYWTLPPQLLKPVLHNRRSHRDEKPL